MRALITTLLLSGAAAHAQPEFFEKKVRPILVSHCYACHSADTKPAGGLRVDDTQAFFAADNRAPPSCPAIPKRA